MRFGAATNDEDHRPRAIDGRYETEASSRGSVDPFGIHSMRSDCMMSGMDLCSDCGRTR